DRRRKEVRIDGGRLLPKAFGAVAAKGAREVIGIPEGAGDLIEDEGALRRRRKRALGVFDGEVASPEIPLDDREPERLERECPTRRIIFRASVGQRAPVDLLAPSIDRRRRTRRGTRRARGIREGVDGARRLLAKRIRGDGEPGRIGPTHADGALRHDEEVVPARSELDLERALRRTEGAVVDVVRDDATVEPR